MNSELEPVEELEQETEGEIKSKVENNLKIKAHSDELYTIIVYGFVPEFMPHRALRRKKHYNTENTKIIKCPYCSYTLTIVEATAKLELIRYPKNEKAKIITHKSMSCGSCRNVVGIIYKAA